MGRLWQSRYKARLVEDPEHLRHVVAYVHLNPVAARTVDDPSDHATSGHREILGLVEPRLCDVGAALLSFDEDQRTARIVYQQCLRAVSEARWLQNGVRDLPWWRTVRDDDETVSSEDAPSGAQDFAGQPLEPERQRRPDLSDVVVLFERKLEIAPGQLAGRSRVRSAARRSRAPIEAEVTRRLVKNEAYSPD